MFDSLKSAFSNVIRGLGERELKEKNIDGVLDSLEISLLEADVALEVTETIKADLKKRLMGTVVNRKEVENFIRSGLIEFVSGIFDRAGTLDLPDEIRRRGADEPYIIVFVGINGTGKTTSLIKVAKLLQDMKISLVIAAADTFRAGAIEQLREHADRLNIKVVAQNYGADPAAVARDAVLYARSHKTDCVLIDTAGRVQTSRNLMEQIVKIVNVTSPDMKIFVGDSLAGNNTVNQAREFHERIKFDAAILTKGDADAKGGAALSIVGMTSAPILYVGVGQEYDDLKVFNKKVFIETVFGKTPGTAVSLQGDPHYAVDLTQCRDDKPGTAVSLQGDPHTIKSDAGIVPSDADVKGSSADPFEGIETDDISRYSKLFDVAPPETAKDAGILAARITQWISQGRPEPSDHGREQKPKKRRSVFGRFRI